MKVSFDLDETLFIDPDKIPAEEKLKFPYCLLYKERLRLGTIELIKKLQGEHMEVWIYTTSFRSKKYIRKLFKCYGVRIDDDRSVLENGKVYGFCVFIIEGNDPMWHYKIFEEVKKINKRRSL